MDKPNRIREMREHAGLTLEQLAEASGISTSYLSRMESGGRNVSLKNVARIATALGVLDRELVGQEVNSIHIEGLVGAGGEIDVRVSQAYGGEATEIVLDIPIPSGVRAFEVWGNSMLPKYDPGDVVLVHRAADPIDLVLGEIALVLTEDGKRFIKRVLRGSEEGRFDLESFNAPTMKNERILEAGLIYVSVPARQIRRATGEKEIVRRRRKAAA